MFSQHVPRTVVIRGGNKVHQETVLDSCPTLERRDRCLSAIERIRQEDVESAGQYQVNLTPQAIQGGLTGNHEDLLESTAQTTRPELGPLPESNNIGTRVSRSVGIKPDNMFETKSPHLQGPEVQKYRDGNLDEKRDLFQTIGGDFRCAGRVPKHPRSPLMIPELEVNRIDQRDYRYGSFISRYDEVMNVSFEHSIKKFINKYVWIQRQRH